MGCGDRSMRFCRERQSGGLRHRSSCVPKSAYKPRSVGRGSQALGPAVISLGAALPTRSSSLPEAERIEPIRTARRTVQFASVWPCSRWGLPGRRHCCRRRWSLTPPFHPRRAWRGTALLCGPVPAGHPAPGITRHRALRSADFPRTAALSPGALAPDGNSRRDRPANLGTSSSVSVRSRRVKPWARHGSRHGRSSPACGVFLGHGGRRQRQLIGKGRAGAGADHIQESRERPKVSLAARPRHPIAQGEG